MEANGMARWKNRVALVTGASFGIGSAIAKTLVRHGMIVIGCARTITAIEEVRQECEASGYVGKLVSRQCDLSKEQEIANLFEWIQTNYGSVDVCVNNAAFSFNKTLMEISAQEMNEMLNVNVVGTVLCTQNSIQLMNKRGIDDGHIFLVNSMLGHSVYGELTFQAATKFAVTALTEGFRRELVTIGSRIRVTSLSPGTVETTFFNHLLGDEQGKLVYKSRQGFLLQPQDIADSLVYALSAPKNVQVHDILIRPTGQPLCFTS